MKAWFSVEAAQHYKDFINNALVNFTEQLVSNFLDKDKNDLSAVLRGRIYQLRDLLNILTEIETFDKMRTELLALENEGYTRTPEEGVMQAGMQIQ